MVVAWNILQRITVFKVQIGRKRNLLYVFAVLSNLIKTVFCDGIPPHQHEMFFGEKKLLYLFNKFKQRRVFGVTLRFAVVTAVITKQLNNPISEVNAILLIRNKRDEFFKIFLFPFLEKRCQ